MKKQTAKKIVSEEKTGLEVISVKIGSKAPTSYKGLGGTYASEKGLLAEAEPKEAGIVLCLSGKRNATQLREVMDIAMLNTGAYPDSGGKAKYFIEVKSEK
jgi:hypothetical protein